MASQNNLLSLTVKSDSSTLYLAEANILRFFLDPVTPGTGTLITYNDPNFFVRETTVTNTPVQVFAATEMFIQVTTPSGTEYLNVLGIVSIVSDGSTGSKIEFYGKSGVSVYVYTSEAPLAIDKLIQALDLKVKTPASYTVAITGNVTLTAAQMAVGLFLPTGNSANVTTPTATALATALGAGIGTTFEWTMDGTGLSGGQTATLVMDGSITNAGAITGYNDLTVAVGEIGKFTLYFNSLTTATLARTL